MGDSLIEKIRDGIDRVDFVAAVISRASVKSKWVSRELDIATNRELRGKRVVLLPILLEDVRLPGFLDGKLFADFRGESRYKQGLKSLLLRLGRGKKKPRVSPSRNANLQRFEESSKGTSETRNDEVHCLSYGVARNFKLRLTPRMPRTPNGRTSTTLTRSRSWALL